MIYSKHLWMLIILKNKESQLHFPISLHNQNMCASVLSGLLFLAFSIIAGLVLWLVLNYMRL